MGTRELRTKISLWCGVSLSLLCGVGCGDPLAGKDAYFGAPTGLQVDVEGGGECEATPAGGEPYQGGGDGGVQAVAGVEGGQGVMGGVSAPVEPCTPSLSPTGEDRSSAAMGCDEGCASLATCAIEEGLCPGLQTCDRAGVIDMCLAICSEQLLAVFSTLSSCAETINLANQGLGAKFASACAGE